MARSVARIGDQNNGGGIYNQSPNTKVTCEGILVVVTGSKGTGHPPNSGLHVNLAWITEGTGKVSIGGVAVCATGDLCSCGHLVQTGGNSKVTIP